MEETKLDKRKEGILAIVIQSYIAKGMPIGSQTVSRNYKLDLSPATIRNEMAGLEETGYLTQPHTSAGRIPTDKGYRYYVNYLMKIKKIAREQIDKIEKECFTEVETLKEIIALEKIVARISRALSNLTNYTGIALFPELESNRLGYQDRLCLEGSWHILDYPEFRDFDSIKRMFEAFEKKSQILEILTEDIEEEGVHIRIGSENRYCELQNCSLVTSRYGVKDEMVGSLGIIGPVRMDYERVVPVVSFLAETITRFLSDYC
jgi:transcriptional regulator of heat shock response